MLRCSRLGCVELLAAVGNFWLVAAVAVAAPVSVVNPGFEDISGESPYHEFTFGPFNGWGLYDPLNITSGGAGPTYYLGTLTPFQTSPGVYANFPDGAAEGTRVAISFNYAGSGGVGEYGYQQTLSETLSPIRDTCSKSRSATSRRPRRVMERHSTWTACPVIAIDLLAGGVPIAQDDNSLFGLIDEGDFGTSTITLTTGPTHPRLGQALGIRLVNLNVVDPLFPDSDLEVDFDHVRLDASPAPDGDYNHDGITDAADYVVWRRFSGEAETYDVWQRDFGEPSGGGAAADLTAVPEPDALGMLAATVAAVLVVRRTKQSNGLAAPGSAGG